MKSTIPLERIYFEVDNWAHRNIIQDLLGEKGSINIRADELGFGDKFQIIGCDSCIIDVLYSRQRRLELKVWGESIESKKKILESLDRNIQVYSKKYCDPIGL